MTQKLAHYTALRRGLRPGSNRLISRDADTEVGLDFSVERLAAGERFCLDDPAAESALLVLGGAGSLAVDDERAEFARDEWIETPPWVAHGAAGARFEVKATRDCELAILKTANAATFTSRLYLPEEVASERRGEGRWDDAACRIVRTVFDRDRAPEPSRLVLGEVVNLPGRWSSYPPHRHRQPEIYYYRFSPERGYGHGELGDEVFQIKQHDLLRITGNRDHSQCAAPGYHMYYLWAIRHLPSDPYRGFEYHPDHRWLLDEREEER